MLIDTHCHLTSAGLVERIDEVIHSARAAGVTRFVLVATNPADAYAALSIMDNRPGTYLVAGIHPHEAGQATPEHIDTLRAILTGTGLTEETRSRIVGVGETGIDLYYDFAPQQRQEELFETHLTLASDLGLPVVIHAREAEMRVCEILAKYPQLVGRVVFHCFSGDTAIARTALDLGCYCSFTGVVTFRKSKTIQESARYVPADRMFVETDAPYLSPEPMRKIRPNEPALLVHTARFLAELRGEAYDALAAATTANAARFFSLPEE